MTLAMQILLVFGAGMLIYAIFGICVSGNSETKHKGKKPNQSLHLPSAVEDSGRDQKIQRLQDSLVELENQLQKSKAEYAQEESAFMKAKENEAKLLEELKRRDEWVVKAEAELAKIKSENSDYNNKFTAKEKELEAEFTKNVNSMRLLNEAKSALAEKETELRLKDDEIQAQKHKIEDQLKTIKEHLASISEFNKKEKISEWVPKEEFNKLNEEYTKLENELEENQERLKSFAEEIAHLRREAQKEMPQLELPVPEEIKPEAKTPADNPEQKEENNQGEEKKGEVS